MNPIVFKGTIIARFLLRGNNTVNVIFLKTPTFTQQVDVLLKVIRQGHQIGDVTGL